jgi:putative acetyltransferase
MFKLYRTDSSDTNFQLLVRDLDLELKIRDGEDQAFYAQYNKSDSIKYAVLAYENSEAVGCGAIKEWNSETMEVKRMFVPLKNRVKELLHSF